MTVHKMIRERLLQDVIETGESIPEQELKYNQWCSRFEQLMRNRLIMGACRYKPLKHGTPNGFDNVNSAIERLKLYQETGNQEHLVDVANLCLVEFATESHPNAHFEAQDDGIHTERLK